MPTTAPRTVSAGGRPPLSRTAVIAAAVDLVDRDGLERLSMRRLATDLGVEAMSLYHHVADKSDLLDGLVAAVLDEMVLPSAGTWREQVSAICHELRRVALAHPQVFPLVVARGFRTSSVLRPAEALIAALRSGGLEGPDAVQTFWTLLSFVSGSIACQLAEQPAAPATDDPSCGATVEASVYPNIDSVAALLFTCDFDRQFSRGLDTVIESVRR